MTLILAYIAYTLIGIFSGVLAGLLGIGGGVITVPCLLHIFKWMGYPQAYIMQMSVATSLAAMILTTLSSTWAHHKRKGVLWEVFQKMIPGLVLGAALGAFLGTWLSGVFLEIFFGIFLCLLAWRFSNQKPDPKSVQRLPSTVTFTSLCAGVGALSNLLGIGGGSLVVPMLTYYRVPDKNAIGTAAAATLLTSVLGSTFYLYLGWEKTPFLENLGLINLPAFIFVGIFTALFAPFGVKLSRQLPPKKVRLIFAAVLALTGISLII